MPMRALLDDDEALEVGPGAVEQGALGQQVAGRVAADVGRVRGQVEQLLLAAEHDLDLLDRAAVAREPVVRRGSARAGRRAGRAPTGATRPRRCSATRCWMATTLVGSSWRLATASDGAGAERDLGRAGEERLAGRRDRRPSAEATSSSTTAAWAPSPRRTIVRVRSARSAAPSAQRTMIGLVQDDAGGHVDDDDAASTAARVELGELVVRGQRAVVEQRAPRSTASSRRPTRAGRRSCAAADSATAATRCPRR